MDFPLDLSNTVIETERLILRPFREDDLDDFFAYASVEGVGEAAGWPHHTSREVSKMVLASFLAEKDVLAVVLKETGQVVGSLGLHKTTLPAVKDMTAKEFGYVLAKDLWGKGLIPEAVRAVIPYAFDTLGCEALTCGHFDFNDRSRRVIEKCGFRYVCDTVYYAKQLEKEFKGKMYVLYRKDRKSC